MYTFLFPPFSSSSSRSTVLRSMTDCESKMCSYLHHNDQKQQTYHVFSIHRRHNQFNQTIRLPLLQPEAPLIQSKQVVSLSVMQRAPADENTNTPERMKCTNLIPRGPRMSFLFGSPMELSGNIQKTRKPKRPSCHLVRSVNCHKQPESSKIVTPSNQSPAGPHRSLPPP